MDKVEVLYSFRQMYEELNQILCRFDPYGLSDGGRIADEFDGEAWDILYGLMDTRELSEVIHLVTNVFAQSFSKESFNQDNCSEVATIIYYWWNNK
ncbi:hypothetical protein [Paenibacillus bovis]|uniref:Uncharacterized protein n=1 Tax=Paenibacillus bovis TaxID=1616788 RepID=A0A172ZBJ6_9BACL|nr:hypothetical protein [Paenibacillus bovis]ANF95025.1 hypothetical protein AR543_02565 [Paenibacillus bovis]